MQELCETLVTRIQAVGFQMTDVTKRFMYGSILSILDKSGNKLVGLLSSLILVRMLLHEDFGVIAITLMMFIYDTLLVAITFWKHALVNIVKHFKIIKVIATNLFPCILAALIAHLSFNNWKTLLWFQNAHHSQFRC